MSEANLAWKLNWYRQSELEGALLLGRLVGAVDDGALAARLTRHCAEEAAHSDLWARAIAAMGLPHFRIHRSYQSFYREHGGRPASLVEALSFTQIFERRVHRRFHEELRAPGLPAPARAAFERMIEDEKDHLAWVAEWLAEQPEAPGLLARYEAIDRMVYDRLRPFSERIWELPGLGDSPLLHHH